MKHIVAALQVGEYHQTGLLTNLETVAWPLILSRVSARWCEFTLLRVISRRGPSSLRCLNSGRRAAGPRQPPHAAEEDSERWPGRGQERGAPLCSSSASLSMASSSARASGHRARARGRLLKYCYSMVSFLPANKRRLSRLFCSLTCADCLFPSPDPS